MNTLRHLIAITVVIFAAATAVADEPAKEPSKSEAATSFENATKLVTAVVGGLTFLFGLPVTLLLIKKTRAETRKLELEAAALQQKLGGNSEVDKVVDSSTLDIRIHDSPNATIKITADPRLLAPLLVVLDFVVASVLISLARYALDFVVSGPLETLLVTLLYAILFIPILRQALRVRHILIRKTAVTETKQTPNKDRDRGPDYSGTPPTPPSMRVRTRRFDAWEQACSRE